MLGGMRSILSCDTADAVELEATCKKDSTETVPHVSTETFTLLVFDTGPMGSNIENRTASWKTPPGIRSFIALVNGRGGARGPPSPFS